jgi:HAD superfamily hydrolase (TIGR01662 family)
LVPPGHPSLILFAVIHTLLPRPRGVLFDYGNTLIPFGQREWDAVGGALVDWFAEEIPGADPARLPDVLQTTLAILHRQRVATGEESDPRDVIGLTFEAFNSVPSEQQFTKGGAVILKAFCDNVRLTDGAVQVLSGLAGRGYRLAVVSNYTHAKAIHVSVARLGIRQYLQAVIVSGDLGVVKPHPSMFTEAARRIGIEVDECVFVGDNLRADIAGAAAVGMRTIYLREHVHAAYSLEQMTEEGGVDVPLVQPDLVIDRLTDLIREE